MGIIATILIGFVIGIIARFLMPGRDPMGFIITTVLGIIGAWFGAWLGTAFGWYAQGEPAGFLMSVVGAMLVLFIYRMIAGRRSTAV